MKQWLANQPAVAGQPVSQPLHQWMQEVAREVNALKARATAAEAKLAAIAAVAAPTGGATTDTQARTAINAIIAGAG